MISIIFLCWALLVAFIYPEKFIYKKKNYLRLPVICVAGYVHRSIKMQCLDLHIHFPYHSWQLEIDSKLSRHSNQLLVLMLTFVQWFVQEFDLDQHFSKLHHLQNYHFGLIHRMNFDRWIDDIVPISMVYTKNSFHTNWNRS